MSPATRVLALIAGVVLTTPALRAQSMAPLMGAKGAAQRAVDATNRHIEAEQQDQSPRPVPQQQSQPTGTQPRQGNTRVLPAAPPPQQGTARTTGKQATPASSVAGKPVGAGGKTPPKGTAATPDAGGSVAARGDKTDITLVREQFAYSVDGRRDPFLSLMKSGDLRPMVSDLRLVTVVYDPAGRSVAILRDLQTKEQYRVKVGQTLGRMRVAQIQPAAVIFTVEAIGQVIQEKLAFNDTTRARSQ